MKQDNRQLMMSINVLFDGCDCSLLDVELLPVTDARLKLTTRDCSNQFKIWIIMFILIRMSIL